MTSLDDHYKEDETCAQLGWQITNHIGFHDLGMEVIKHYTTQFADGEKKAAAPDFVLLIISCI